MLLSASGGNKFVRFRSLDYQKSKPPFDTIYSIMPAYTNTPVRNDIVYRELELKKQVTRYKPFFLSLAFANFS